MRREPELGTSKNLHGEECCIYVDRKATEKTLALIVEPGKVEKVELVLAHDIE
jgi:hypothetical protein